MARRRAKIAAGTTPGSALIPRAGVGESALARVRSIETLEDAYEAWLELKLEHAALARKLADERKKLLDQGQFLVGAVRAASTKAGPPSGAAELVGPDQGLDGFLRQAETKLAGAGEALERQAAADEAAYRRAFEAIGETVRERVERFAKALKPKLSLMVRSVGPARRILHLARVSPDEAVLLLFLFSGCIPSRHGFLFDDSTDDPLQASPTLYAEEGVAAAEVRPGASALRQRVRSQTGVLPVKGWLPMFVPRSGSGEDFYRLLQRGPVMEVEIAEGEGFRNILSREEAEACAGQLLRLKLEGRIELELEPG